MTKATLRSGEEAVGVGTTVTPGESAGLLPALSPAESRAHEEKRDSDQDNAASGITNHRTLLSYGRTTGQESPPHLAFYETLDVCCVTAPPVSWEWRRLSWSYCLQEVFCWRRKPG
jgi:hypothetical protein